MSDAEQDWKKWIQEVIKSDPELPKRICDQMKIAQQERLKAKMIFGYGVIDGKPTINEQESTIVKWIYERYFSYSENPPVELVEIAKKQPKHRGNLPKDMPYEEAKRLVTDYLIKEYIAHELSLKELYHQALSQKNAPVPLKDILALPMEEIPKVELEKLMSDISELERMRKAQEASRLVKRVLSEEFYSGVTKFRRWPVKGNRIGPFEDQFIVVNDHEAIISPEMFQAAQKKQLSLKQQNNKQLER